jgi:hypothetical protein
MADQEAWEAGFHLKATLDPALLHRRKVCRTHVRHVYFFHDFAGPFGVLSDQLLKIWIGSHSIPALFRLLLRRGYVERRRGCTS